VKGSVIVGAFPLFRSVERCTTRHPQTGRRCDLPYFHQSLGTPIPHEAWWGLFGRKHLEWKEPGVVYEARHA